MATRIPASLRTREGLTALIEGRLSTASAKDQLVKLATRLIVEEVRRLIRTPCRRGCDNRLIVNYSGSPTSRGV